MGLTPELKETFENILRLNIYASDSFDKYYKKEVMECLFKVYQMGLEADPSQYWFNQCKLRDQRISELENAMNKVSINNNSGKPNRFVINDIINNALNNKP